MASPPPARKKQKQVLLGDWLVKPGEKATRSGGQLAGHGQAGQAPPPDTRVGGSRSRRPEPGQGREWGDYESPRGGRRTDSNAAQERAIDGSSRPPAAGHGYGNPYHRDRGKPVVIPVPSPGRPGGSQGPRGQAAEQPRAPAALGASGAGVPARVEAEAARGAGDKVPDEEPLPEGVEEIIGGLCEEQRHVIGLVLRGKSVFFTGAAGTGKSFLLKRLHQALQHVGKGPGTFLTGTTGKSAVGIGGCTVHSFAGIGLGDQAVEELLARVTRSRQARKRWAECAVLVIDEISMMDANLFDKLNLIGQRVRGDPRPFGGIQLVLCGDFFQLPPVGIGRGSTRFCFEARTWDTSVEQSIVLKQVFRQRDPSFLRILHEMREGRVTEAAREVLGEKVRQTRAHLQASLEVGDIHGVSPGAGGTAGEGGKAIGDRGGVEGTEGRGAAGTTTFTRLFSKNADVDYLNQEQLAKLEGESLFFEASDEGETSYLKQLQSHCAAPEELELKVGAKVLLLKNLDASSQLINGSTGEVREFVEASGRRLPKVEFDPMEGREPVVAVIREEEWTISLGEREMARRVQLPLRLAWALSVHKAQGMTIPHVMVSTQGMFEYGQAYVALSRATTLSGLQLLNFDPRVVRAHSKVKAFYAELEELARGGGSTEGVTAIPRRGPEPAAADGWIPRSTHSAPAARVLKPLPPPQASSPSSPSPTREPVTGAGSGHGADSAGASSAMSPALRARIVENRRRALEKLAAKRAKAVQGNP